MNSMNCLEDINNLEEILQSGEEIIIYGAGAVAHDMIEYIDFIGLSNRICCVGVSKKEGNLSQIGELSVIPLDSLGHYKDSAVFIISTLEDKHREIGEKLTQFGCKKIIYPSNRFINSIRSKEVKNKIKEMNDGKMLNTILTRIDELEWRIEEQNELCKVNTNTFSEYKNINWGKDVVIVATGPTMKKYVPIPGAVHIGVNGAWRRSDIKLDYYFVQDGYRENLSVTAEGLTDNKIKCPIFIGAFLKRWQSESFMTFPEEFYMKENVRKYYADSFPSGRNRTRDIYRDICLHPVADFNSIVFPALHFALYTYPKNIFLVGCDTSGASYFYDTEQKSKIQNDIMYIKRGYSLMKDFADYAYPQTKIISINPVGLKGLFYDKYM